MLTYINCKSLSYRQQILHNNNFVYIGCLAGSGPPSPNRDKPLVPKTKPETKKKWLKLTRKGLLLSSICKVGKHCAVARNRLNRRFHYPIPK